MSTVPRRAIVVAAFASIGLALLAAVPTRACLNDRDTDTLAKESRALPGMVEVITGRFERNPPLYYQMRIARIEKELKQNPDDFAQYDDIAVAYDRLGESGKALKWMEKKRERLGLFEPDTPPSQWGEEWYRYYANDGTFRVHRWLHDGANRDRIAEVVLARSEIAKAIAINPDAHFGRETYQLQVMDWIITGGNDRSGHRVRLSAMLEEKPGQPITQGIAGLIVLGNAWESVDVFDALATRLDEKDDHILGYMAHLRVSELRVAGKKSLNPLPDQPPAGKNIREEREMLRGTLPVFIENTDELEEMYDRLRPEAREWEEVRVGFMMSRLSRGQHPDTHPAFWNGYTPKPAPALTPSGFDVWRDKLFVRNNPLMSVVGYLSPVIFIFFVARDLAGRRRSKMMRQASR